MNATGNVHRLFCGLFLAALSVFGFASTFVVGAALTKDCGVSSSVLSFLRFAIAGGVMFALGAISRRERVRMFSLSRRDWLLVAWLGPVGTSFMAWCVFMGCARVSAANASMADALTPLMIFAVAALRARHAEAGQIFGLVAGLVGALLVIQILTLDGVMLEAYTLGDVFVLLAAATWGFYTAFGREPIERLGSSVFTLWTMLAGALAIGLTLPFTENAWPCTAQAWTLVLVLGFVSTLLPFWTWNAAQKYLPMSVLGVSAYFTPVVAVFLAMMFLGEGATWLQWLGTVFIIASAAVETGREKGR